MTRALLDTSAVVNTPRGLLDDADELAVSVVTLGELRAGIIRASDGEDRAMREASFQVVTELFAPVQIDVAVAMRFGEVLAHARAERRTQKSTDLLIIAAASATERTLVTRDRKQAALAESFGVEAELAA